MKATFIDFVRLRPSMNPVATWLEQQNEYFPYPRRYAITTTPRPTGVPLSILGLPKKKRSQHDRNLARNHLSAQDEQVLKIGLQQFLLPVESRRVVDHVKNAYWNNGWKWTIKNHFCQEKRVIPKLPNRHESFYNIFSVIIMDWNGNNRSHLCSTMRDVPWLRSVGGS